MVRTLNFRPPEDDEPGSAARPRPARGNGRGGYTQLAALPAPPFRFPSAPGLVEPPGPPPPPPPPPPPRAPPPPPRHLPPATAPPPPPANFPPPSVVFPPA